MNPQLALLPPLPKGALRMGWWLHLARVSPSLHLG